MTTTDQASFDQRRAAISALSLQLAADVASACPGTHVLVQHRDQRPPWCPACRRSRYGWNAPDDPARQRPATPPETDHGE